MVSYSRIIFAVVFVTGLCAASLPASAQRTSGGVGLGGQLGEPSGVTLKFYDAQGPSYDFLAAWDLDDRFFLNGHALFENNIQANIDPDLHWFIGPGGFIGVFDAPEPVEDDALIGISGTVGLNLVFNRRVELYGRLTPRLEVIPETEGGVGGGLGVRYYF